MHASWTTAQMPSQTGKRILITGANSGIGYTAALGLARAGATILLACRDRLRGEDAVARLRREAPDAPTAHLLLLDLALLASIHAVADEVLAAHHPIDVLINNAGVFAPTKRLETQDGFEVQWGTNVLGHFALTCRLLPALQLAPAARVVTIASIAHKRGRLHFDDLQWTRRYNRIEAYAQSKLGDLMFALELERRLTTRGFAIRSIAAHPGVARSALFKVGNSKGLAALAERVVSAGVGLVANDDTQGAMPTLFAATAPDAAGGAYYGPQGLQEMRGGDVGPAMIARQALDQASAQRLWQHCAQATDCDL